MGIVSLPSFGSDPATVNAANLDGKVDPLATEFNGNIDNNNIKAAAGIVDTKLATISTAAKVNTSALTTTSQAAGDILYNNGSGWVRLAKGNARGILRTNAGATAPEWSDQETVRAWIKLDGTANPPTVNDHYNIDTANIVDNGDGNYTIPYDTDMAAADHVVVGTVLASGMIFALSAIAAGSCTVTVEDNDGTATDHVVMMLALGA